MDANDFIVDPAAIEAGEWIDNIPDCGDLRIKTRGAGNADWNKVWQRELGKTPRSERRSALTAASLERIQNACLVEAGILEVANFTEKGEPVTVERAKEMICDPRFRTFRAACLYAANRVGENIAEDAEGAEKN